MHHRHPHCRTSGRHVAVLLTVTAVSLFILTTTSRTARGQGISPGSGIIYFPEPHNRVLVAGGAVGLNGFTKFLVSVDLSSPFPASTPKTEALPQILPDAFRFLTPAARASDDGKSFEITLFGGVNAARQISQELWLMSTENGKSLSTNVALASTQPKFVLKWPCQSGVAMAMPRDFKPQVNRGPVVVANDPTVYVFGGLSVDTYRNTKSLLAYNPTDRTFRTVPLAPGTSAPRERNSASLVRLDENRLLLTGGWANDTAAPQGETQLSDAWTFDLKENKWTKYPRDLAMPRFLHSTVVYKSAVGSTFAIIVGGQDGSPLVEYSDISKSGEWKRLSVSGNKPEVKTLIEPQALLLGDQILVFGAILKETQRGEYMPLGIIKVKEEQDGNLSFAWEDNFTPLPSTAPVVDPQPSGGMDLGMIIAIVVCVIGVAGMGAFVYLRKRNQARAELELKQTSLSPAPSAGHLGLPTASTCPSSPSATQQTPHFAQPPRQESPYMASPANPHQAPFTGGAAPAPAAAADHLKSPPSPFGVYTAPAPPAVAVADPYADLFSPMPVSSAGGPPPLHAMQMAPAGDDRGGHVELEIREQDDDLFLPTGRGAGMPLQPPAGHEALLLPTAGGSVNVMHK